jgi:hypothetical protein
MNGDKIDKELAACKSRRDEARRRYHREAQYYKQKTEDLALKQAETQKTAEGVVARMVELQQDEAKISAYHAILLARVKQHISDLERVYGTLDALLKVFGAGEMLADALARARACVGRQGGTE